MASGKCVVSGFMKVLFIVAAAYVAGVVSLGLGIETTDTGGAGDESYRLEFLSAMRATQGLVHSSKADGDEHLYYKGDTAAFNRFLQKLAEMNLAKLRIDVNREYGKIDHKARYGWILHIPDQTYQGTARDKIVQQAYPSVTVYAGSDMIHLGDVVLPRGAEMVAVGSAEDDYLQVAHGVETANKWAKARRKWLEFIGPHIEGLRLQDNDPSIQWVEMRSKLVSEYLPGHIIRLIETSRFGRSCVFAVSVSGEISDLGSLEWSQKKGQEYYRSVKFSDFFSVQGFSVADANAAIDIIKLAEEICLARGLAIVLRRDTNNFTIFDARLYRRVSWNKNWEYDAVRGEGYWLVTRSYVGPPTSTHLPPKWEIVLDKKGVLAEIRRK